MYFLLFYLNNQAGTIGEFIFYPDPKSYKTRLKENLVLGHIGECEWIITGKTIKNNNIIFSKTTYNILYISIRIHKSTILLLIQIGQ